jgi:hypothetical protein
MRRTYPSRNFIVPSTLVHSVIPSRFRTSHCSRLLWHTPLCLPTSLHSTITNSSSKSPPPFTSEAFPFCTVRCSHPPLFTVGAFSFRTAWCFFYRQSFSFRTLRCSPPHSPLFTVEAFFFHTVWYPPLPPVTVGAFCFYTVWCSRPPLFTVGAFFFRTVWCLLPQSLTALSFSPFTLSTRSSVIMFSPTPTVRSSSPPQLTLEDNIAEDEPLREPLYNDSAHHFPSSSQYGNQPGTSTSPFLTLTLVEPHPCPACTPPHLPF